MGSEVERKEWTVRWSTRGRNGHVCFLLYSVVLPIYLSRAVVFVYQQIIAYYLLK